MNIIKKKKYSLFYESRWRQNRNCKLSDVDSSDVKFPYPTERINTHGYKWKGGKNQFTEKLKNVQRFAATNKNINKNKDCVLCNKKNISDIEYNISNIVWDSGLCHYVTEHDVKPTQQFIDIIYNSREPKTKTHTQSFHADSMTYIKDGLSYVKLDKIHINIFDALMEHGGGNKKYKDKQDPNIVRNSEHAGLIDYNKNGLDKIIISGNTDRVDKNDDEIYMPKNIPEAYDYEYIFHTHPPTPTPGGRAEYGILYEFPSISDIFHFIDHFNDGNTQGSIIMAPEGLYCIRKFVFDQHKIKINENELFKNLKSIYQITQDDAIKKYGEDFTEKYFYKHISQNKSYINRINDILHNFELHVDFYSRTYDKKNDIWYVNTIYLPIFITEPVKS
jgi:hypothetical protein